MQPRSLFAILAGLGLPASIVGTPTGSSETKELAVPELEPRVVAAVEQFAWSMQNENIFRFPLAEGFAGVSCIDCQASSDIIVDVIVPEEGEGIENALFNVTFYNTGANLDLDIFADGQADGFFGLWETGTPGSQGDVAQLGLVFAVGIAYDISANINLQGGFRFEIPDGAFIAFNLAREVKDISFAGAVAESIPFEVTSGSATIKLALQLRVSLVAGIDVGPIEGNAEAALYVNIPEVVANVHSSDDCSLETTAFLNINVGAFAESNFRLDFDVGEKEVGIDEGEGHTIGATLWTGPTGTHCWDEPTSSSIPEIEAPTTTSAAIIDESSTQPLPETPADSTTVQETSSTPAAQDFTTSSTELEPTSTTEPAQDDTTSSTEPESTSTKVIKDTTTPAPQPPVITKSYSNLYGNSTVTKPPVMHTSTVYSTKVYTVVTCAAHVMNCPAKWAQTVVVTDVVELYTTVCPVTETQTVPSTTSTPKATTKIVFENPVTLTACPTPIKEVFITPTYAEPKVATTTVCTTRHPGSSDATVVKVPSAVSTSHAPPAVTHDAPVTTHVPLPKTSEYPPANGTASVVQVTAGAQGQGAGSAVAILACLIAGVLAF